MKADTLHALSRLEWGRASGGGGVMNVDTPHALCGLEWG